jgi:hypothetical protein
MVHRHSQRSLARRYERAVARGYLQHTRPVGSPSRCANDPSSTSLVVEKVVARRVAAFADSIALQFHHCQILGQHVHIASLAAALAKPFIGRMSIALPGASAARQCLVINQQHQQRMFFFNIDAKPFLPSCDLAISINIGYSSGKSYELPIPCRKSLVSAMVAEALPTARPSSGIPTTSSSSTSTMEVVSDDAAVVATLSECSIAQVSVEQQLLIALGALNCKMACMHVFTGQDSILLADWRALPLTNGNKLYDRFSPLAIAPMTSSSTVSDDQCTFVEYDNVVITNLLKQPLLSGIVGQLGSFDESNQRWPVHLQSGQVCSIKPLNLTLASAANILTYIGLHYCPVCQCGDPFPIDGECPYCEVYGYR